LRQHAADGLIQKRRPVAGANRHGDQTAGPPGSVVGGWAVKLFMVAILISIR
jgi:hypothetical protein